MFISPLVGALRRHQALAAHRLGDEAPTHQVVEDIAARAEPHETLQCSEQSQYRQRAVGGECVAKTEVQYQRRGGKRQSDGLGEALGRARYESSFRDPGRYHAGGYKPPMGLRVGPVRTLARKP